MSAEEAFQVAIEYFANQLDRDLPGDSTPSTAYDYYSDARGWSDQTIQEKHLGYAPADPRGLRDHLMRRGFSREAILGTGLFYPDEEKGVYPHFCGRYVLPYFNEAGTPVYAISRSIDEDNGGHPNDHHGEQKYTKAVKSKKYSKIDEPIYGAETVDVDVDRLLVAGGIADAITLHEAGYACISPVTTVRFKDRHEQQVAQLIQEYNINRVYQLNDAERPTVDRTELSEVESVSSIGDVLTIHQYGEGLRGAFGNVEFLEDTGAEAYFVRLPGGNGDLRKLDPDDYIHEQWGTVETLLAGARLASNHAGYTEWNRNRKQRAIAETPDSEDSHSGESSSALFDLSFTDVAPMSAGDRGDNPLGHHGNSHDYFVAVEDGSDVYGYDHKHNEAYNALTYLLCEAGERRADNPDGRLDDEDILTAWTQAKKKRALGSDDPIPYRALKYAAVDAGVINPEEFVERESEDGGTYEGFPDASAYNQALDVVREVYGVDPGREPADAGGESVTALPLQRLQALDPKEARRYAKRRDVDWPSTSEARERLRERVMQAMRAGETVVLDAPTALGKSHTVATEPWLRRATITDEKPVVHFHETCEARDQAAEASSNAEITHAKLRGRREACPIAAGEHDPDDSDDLGITVNGAPASEWFDAMCEGRGVPFSVAHTYLAEHNDQDINPPCSENGDGDPIECPAFAQWNGIPRDGDTGEATVDVIHATHQFSYVPSLRQGTHTVFDERPSFTVDLSTDRVQQIVTAYLKAVDAPVETWESFVNLASFNPERYDDVAAEMDAERDRLADALEIEPDREWYLEAADAHTIAPAVARAIFYALRDEPDVNGRRAGRARHEPPRLDRSAHDEDGWNRTWVSVVLDEDNRIRTVRNAPDLTLAQSVIGLDAQPSAPLWQRNVHPDVTVDPVLEAEERRLWRLFERGLTVIQVGEHTRPLSSGQYFNEDRTGAVIERLRSAYGEQFGTCITASAVEDRTAAVMEEAGIQNPETMHFGEEKSRNDFADESVGFVNGCIDPGDDYVLDLLAEADLDATPETSIVDGENKRARGRGFEGEDAETAAAILASVRENHVAQAAGRYARDADNSGDRATVFVRTDALPPGYADLQVPGVEWVATELQREIIEELARRPSATVRELAGAVDASKEHVRKTLQTLQEDGLVSRRESAGEHGSDVYRALAGEQTAVVNLDGIETANDAVCGSYTWSLAIQPGGRVKARDRGCESSRSYTQKDVSDQSQEAISDYTPG